MIALKTILKGITHNPSDKFDNSSKNSSIKRKNENFRHAIMNTFCTSSDDKCNTEKKNLRPEEMSSISSDSSLSSKSFMGKESPGIDTGQSLDGDVNSLLMLKADGVPYARVNKLRLSPERGLGAFNRASFLEKTYFNSRVRSLVYDKSSTASALQEECLLSDTSASSSPREYNSPAPSSSSLPSESNSPASSSPLRPMDGSSFIMDEPIIHTLSCFIAVCAIKLNVDPNHLISEIQYVLNNNLPFDRIRDLVMSGTIDRYIEGGASPSSITDVLTPSSSVPDAGIPSSIHNTVSHIPLDDQSSDVPNQPLGNIDSTNSLGFKLFIGTALLLMAGVLALSFYNGCSSGVALPPT